MRLMQISLFSLFFLLSLNMNAQSKSKENFNFPKDRKTNIAVLVYDGVEIVDTGGPMDVFTRNNKKSYRNY